jgi:hypothetical protein
MRVSDSVRFESSVPAVYVYLARTVLSHAVEPQPDEAMNRKTPILTRYRTKLWPITVVTTEEATLEPGQGITWRHVDGPLSGSVETFRIETPSGQTVVRYEGEIRARNPLLRGPVERLLVGPLTRMVSMRALRDAQRAIEGEKLREGGQFMIDGSFDSGGDGGGD